MAEEETPATPPAKSYDEDYVRKLRAEAKSHREGGEEARRKLAEVETQLQSLSKVNDELTAARLETMRLRAARAAGLPDDVADRLRGKTPDELKADAEALVKSLPRARTTDAGQHANGSPPASSPSDTIRGWMKAGTTSTR